MNLETAKQELSKAKSIEDWNVIRSLIKNRLSVNDLAIIDGSGFVKVVKAKQKWVSPPANN